VQAKSRMRDPDREEGVIGRSKGILSLESIPPLVGQRGVSLSQAGKFEIAFGSLLAPIDLPVVPVREC